MADNKTDKVDDERLNRFGGDADDILIDGKTLTESAKEAEQKKDATKKSPPQA